MQIKESFGFSFRMVTFFSIYFPFKQKRLLKLRWAQRAMMAPLCPGWTHTRGKLWSLDEKYFVYIFFKLIYIVLSFLFLSFSSTVILLKRQWENLTAYPRASFLLVNKVNNLWLDLVYDLGMVLARLNRTFPWPLTKGIPGPHKRFPL